MNQHQKAIWWRMCFKGSAVNIFIGWSRVYMHMTYVDMTSKKILSDVSGCGGGRGGCTKCSVVHHNRWFWSDCPNHSFNSFIMWQICRSFDMKHIFMSLTLHGYRLQNVLVFDLMYIFAIVAFFMFLGSLKTKYICWLASEYFHTFCMYWFHQFLY